MKSLLALVKTRSEKGSWILPNVLPKQCARLQAFLDDLGVEWFRIRASLAH